MTDPQFLAPPPKRGPGVRRLNRRPLLLVAALLLLVSSAIGFTIYQRTKHATQQAATEQKKSASPGHLSALDHAPRQNVLPIIYGNRGAPPQQIKPNPLVDQPSHAPGPSESSAQPGDAGAQEKARLAAWEAYYARIADLKRLRVEGENDAARSDLTGRSSGGAGLSTTTQPSGQQGAGSASSPGVDGNSNPYGPTLPDATGAREKQAFFAQRGSNPADDTLLAVVRDPLSPYMVMAGNVIPAAMDGGATSDIPGQITGHVTTDVCDTATGQHLLIPAYSKIVGTYDNVVSAGQDRLPAIVSRIIFPDTSSIDIGTMPVADQGGYAGQHDQVDHHYWEKFGNALLVAFGSAAIQISQPQSRGNSNGGYDSQQLIAGGIGQQFGQLGQEIARSGLAIPNTISIRPGYAFAVRLTKDMVLQPYQDRRGGPERSPGCSPTSPPVQVNFNAMQ